MKLYFAYGSNLNHEQMQLRCKDAEYIKNDFKYKPPLRRYLNTINQGYIDCNLDREYLKKRLSHYNMEL